MTDIHSKENINIQDLGYDHIVNNCNFETEAMLADYAEALSWRLDTFKPSDREMFKSALQDPNKNDAARFAVKLYLMHWADTDWHDDSIRRLGKWLGIHASNDTKSKLVTLFENDQHEVYKILINAMNGR